MSIDHQNDIQSVSYMLYSHKLINYATYELLSSNNIKLLLPVGKSSKSSVSEMVRKNKILKNKKDFSEYKLSFKEHVFVPELNSFLGINVAYQTCKNEFNLTTDEINGCVSLFCFQIFTQQQAFEILEQNLFKKNTAIFYSLERKKVLLRLDDSPDKSYRSKRVYTFSKFGISIVKKFYELIENKQVSDFVFKNKKELLVDKILSFSNKK
jgi:hypothetical protein